MHHVPSTDVPPASPCQPRLRRPADSPLGHLRAAVLRGDDQLHRPAGHRHPQADAPAGVRLERDRLRGHRVCVPARLCHRPAAGRAHHGSDRRATRLRGRDRALEPRGDGACRGAGCSAGASRPCSAIVGLTYIGVGRRLHRRAVCCSGWAKPAISRPPSRSWRSGFRSASGRSRPGMFNSGTNIGALVTPLVVPWITLTWGWYWAFIATGAIGFLWLVAVAAALRHARRRIRAFERERAGATSAAIRPSRRRTCRGRSCCRYRQTWAFAARQVHDRSDLVAVPVLDPGLPEPESRHRSADGRAAARRHLSRSRTSAASAAAGCRRALIKRGWSVNAGRKTAMLVVRARGRADRVRVEGERSVGGGRARRPCGRGASGLVGQSLHAGVGHVSAPGGRFGRRNRRAWPAPSAGCSSPS